MLIVFVRPSSLTPTTTMTLSMDCSWESALVLCQEWLLFGRGPTRARGLGKKEIRNHARANR